MRAQMLCVLLVLGAGMVFTTGCDKLTAAGAAKVAEMEQLAADAQKKLATAYETYNKLKGEYDTIVLQVKAGVLVTQAMAARLADLTPAMVAAAGDVKNLYQSYLDFNKKRDEAAAAGVPWYWQIPWAAIITAAGGILVGDSDEAELILLGLEARGIARAEVRPFGEGVLP